VTRLNSSGLTSTKGEKIEVNAELTQMLIGPNSSPDAGGCPCDLVMVGDIDWHHHRSCSGHAHLGRSRNEPDLATSQQRTGVPTLCELTYHGPADATACARYRDNTPAYVTTVHA
jgi:hypothetical protein